MRLALMSVSLAHWWSRWGRQRQALTQYRDNELSGKKEEMLLPLSNGRVMIERRVWLVYIYTMRQTAIYDVPSPGGPPITSS